MALASLNKFPWSKVAYYVLAQYLGGLVGALIVYLNYREAINEFDGGLRSAYGNETSTGAIFATYPAPHVTIFGSFVDQVRKERERKTMRYIYFVTISS